MLKHLLMNIIIILIKAVRPIPAEPIPAEPMPAKPKPVEPRPARQPPAEPTQPAAI